MLGTRFWLWWSTHYLHGPRAPLRSNAAMKPVWTDSQLQRSRFSFMNVQLSTLRNILTWWLLYPTPVVCTGFQLASAIGVMTHRTGIEYTWYICDEIKYQILLAKIKYPIPFNYESSRLVSCHAYLRAPIWAENCKYSERLAPPSRQEALWSLGRPCLADLITPFFTFTMSTTEVRGVTQISHPCFRGWSANQQQIVMRSMIPASATWNFHAIGILHAIYWQRSMLDADWIKSGK